MPKAQGKLCTLKNISYNFMCSVPNKFAVFFMILEF